MKLDKAVVLHFLLSVSCDHCYMNDTTPEDPCTQSIKNYICQMQECVKGICVFCFVFLFLQACAPLYHWRTLKDSPEKDPVGTCYVAIQNFSAYAEYSPCRNSKY